MERAAFLFASNLQTVVRSEILQGIPDPNSAFRMRENNAYKVVFGVKLMA